MFPIRGNRIYDNRGMMNNVCGSSDGDCVRNERKKLDYPFFRCFVVFVRFWGVVTAIGELV